MSGDSGAFELFLMPGKNPSPLYLRQYNEAFECWKNTWEDALENEMGQGPFMSSDGFTRQDEILALYFRGKCAGVVCFRRMDFSEAASFKDSYFEHWPTASIRELCRNGKKILILSQFAISHEHRRILDGINPRDLLVGLCYEVFLRSECDAGASAVRVQKNMQKAAYSVGATALENDVRYSFGQRVDLIAYFREKIHSSTVPGITELSNTLLHNFFSKDQLKNNTQKRFKMFKDLPQRLGLIKDFSRQYPWKDPGAYGLFLSQTYYYVCHSTRLLALAAGSMGPADVIFHQRFLEHAMEEKGHDIMLQNNIKELGMNLHDFPELPETKMFWEPQYVKIQQQDPLALLGYVFMLEALAVHQCQEVLAVLEKVYSPGALSFLRVHGKEDPEHLAQALEMIKSVGPERAALIESNFEQSLRCYELMTMRMIDMAKGKLSLKVA